MNISAVQCSAVSYPNAVRSDRLGDGPHAEGTRVILFGAPWASVIVSAVKLTI